MSRAVTNPTFDPVSPAGRHARLLPRQPRRASQPARVPRRPRADPPRVPRPRRPPRHAWTSTASRRCWLFPTLGMIYEELLKHDPEAVTPHVHAPSTAGSRRTGASPTRTASSPRPTSPSPTSTGPSRSSSGRSTTAPAPSSCARPPSDHRRRAAARPADPIFDPFWARVNEAGITVVVHAGDSGVLVQRLRRRRLRRHLRAAACDAVGQDASPSSGPIHDFLAARSCSTSSSSGSPTCASRRSRTAPSSCPTCSEAARRTANKMPGYFPEDPVEMFRRHVWINPFWEDDVDEVVELMGADRVHLRLRLAPHRGHAAAARLRAGAQGASTTTTSAGSCSTTSRELNERRPA